MTKAPVRVAVTGAAGQIGYALLFRIASGEMLGKDQPVILQLLEIPDEKAQKALKGVMMELDDCAFPLLAGMDAHSDPATAFKDADVALLVGARPRGPGMERKDLLAANAQDLHRPGQGARRGRPSAHVKVLVVGNPANTNAYIAMKSAPSLPKSRTSPRCCGSTTTARCRSSPQGPASRSASIEKLIVWGNHSPTMYPDYPLRHRRRQAGQGPGQRRRLEPRHLHPHRRQARRRDHRGARSFVRRVRGQCRDRPRARLGARLERQVGDDGHGVRRQLRHPART